MPSAQPETLFVTEVPAPSRCLGGGPCPPPTRRSLVHPRVSTTLPTMRLWPVLLVVSLAGCETRLVLATVPPCSGCTVGCCDGTSCVAPAAQATSRCGAGGAFCRACGGDDACVDGVCTPTSSGSCGPSTCADGCCENGQCIRVANQGQTACGRGGTACTRCFIGDTCVQGNCQFSCASCSTGCCTGNGLCVDGTNKSQCGRPGTPCQRCASKERCISGVCTPCNGGNCGGCCDFFGECQPGTTSADCGKGGSSCESCFLSQQCVSGACR